MMIRIILDRSGFSRHWIIDRSFQSVVIIKKHAIILITWTATESCANVSKDIIVSWVIFFVNGTLTEGEKERTREQGTGRSPGRYHPRGGLCSPLPWERTRKIISSSCAVYENNIVKHDLVRLALNVIVVNLSWWFRYRNVYLCPVQLAALVRRPNAILNKLQKAL